MKRKILICFGLLIAVAILISIIHHYQLRAATNAYIAKLKAQGEPMDLAQLIASPVPPEQNGADVLRKADEMFHTNNTLLSTNYYYFGMRMVAQGKAAVVTQQPDLRSSDSTNSWWEVQTAVAQNTEALALLHQIIQKPNFDMGIHYEKGIEDLGYTNLLLSETKANAMRLGTAALSDLRQGHTAAATENVRAMLAVAEGMRQERLIISELVRIAIAAVAVSDTWEILQSKNVTDEQLAALQKDWTDLEFLHSYQDAFEMERATVHIGIEKMRNQRSILERELLDPAAAPWMDAPKLTALDRLRIKSRVFRWRYWWSYPDEIRALKGGEMILEALSVAQTNDSWLAINNELESNVAKLTITNENNLLWSTEPMNVDLHFVLSGSVPRNTKTFNRIVKMETTRRMVVIAIALKRYHLKHGESPAALDALAPKFFATVLRDPIDGQPLRYQRKSDGSFTLYSIGDDGKDDGGDPTPSEEHKLSLQWQRGRDWVWPQPATAEEIQKFYDNPPK